MRKIICLAVLAGIVLGSCKKSDKPGSAVVSTNAPTNITATGAQLGGTITSTGNSPISEEGVCWAMHNPPTITDSLIKSSTISNSTYSVSMSNLGANTTYYIRAYVINGIGTSYGAVDSFVTSKGVPTVTTTAISNNAALSAQSGGTVVNTGGASITEQGLVWSTSANPTTANSKMIGSLSATTFADTLNGLTLGSVYYVRAYATNSYGTGYGNQVSFTVSSTGTVTDYDGNAYPTVTIGTQTWTTMNLRVRHFSNGDTIINGLTSLNLDTITVTPAYTFPNGDTANNMTYGKLYTEYAAIDPRGLAPAGWHVATDNDWYTLEFYEGLTATDTASNPSDFGVRGTIGGKLLQGGVSGLNLQLAGYYCPGCGGYTSFGSVGVYLSSTFWGTSTLDILRAFNLAGAGPIYRSANLLPGSIRLVKN